MPNFAERTFCSSLICLFVRSFVLFFFFFLRILNIFNTHIRREKIEGLKETDNSVYPKRPNSWIYSADFKPL